MRNKLITDEMRLRLKKPLGRLMGGKALIRALGRSRKLLISVGDIVTLQLLDNSMVPDVCFIDFRCKREAISEAQAEQLRKFRAKIVRVRNPPGMISSELMEACKGIFHSGSKTPIKVVVEGEEDLAVLAAAIYAPLGSRIIYGQPDEGAVLIQLTAKAKESAERYYENALAVNGK